MTNILTYRNYSAAVEFDAEDALFFGRIAGIADGVTFHAETVAELVTAFHEAVDDYLATCARLGKSPDKPYSGKLLLRIDPALHARTAKAAELAGLSINQWAERAIAAAAG